MRINEQDEIDSPMVEEQVEVFKWVPQSIKLLNDLGYEVSLVTNQPAAAKKKTTKSDLLKVHQRVIAVAESAGGKILSSHICFHRREDQCECRKPQIGMLKEAITKHRHLDCLWMVGDRASDILAGKRAGLKTALVEKNIEEDERSKLKKLNIVPEVFSKNLWEFCQNLRKNEENSYESRTIR